MGGDEKGKIGKGCRRFGEPEGWPELDTAVRMPIVHVSHDESSGEDENKDRVEPEAARGAGREEAHRRTEDSATTAAAGTDARFLRFPIDPLPFPPTERVPVARVRENSHVVPAPPGGPYKRPRHHYVHREETEVELMERVEYDMDSDDERFLAAIQGADPRHGAVSRETLELVMDRLEKEHFTDVVRTARARLREDEIDDDRCQVCLGGDSEDVNQIVFCDGCDLGVHQDCYGVAQIPHGRWLCRTCEAGGRSPRCVLCPRTTGVFKRTDDGRWAHVQCALWIPETAMQSEALMEPVEFIDRIPRERWRLLCVICGTRKGACIQCSNEKCTTAYHVTCAQEKGLSMTAQEYVDDDGTLSVERVSYCVRHTPKEAAAVKT